MGGLDDPRQRESRVDAEPSPVMIPFRHSSEETMPQTRAPRTRAQSKVAAQVDDAITHWKEHFLYRCFLHRCQAGGAIDAKNFAPPREIPPQLGPADCRTTPILAACPVQGLRIMARIRGRKETSEDCDAGDAER